MTIGRSSVCARLQTSSALYHATEGVRQDDLQWMTLQRNQLPLSYSGFQLLREGLLDNETLAKCGIRERSARALGSIGRITGYMRGVVTTLDPGKVVSGTDLAVATVVHLFDHGFSVSRWMKEMVLGNFQ